MRDYGNVSPRFWIGATGKELRGNPEAQVLSLYLMTSPHSNMIGVFHCPVLYMAHETGMTMEGASKALARLIEVGFCEYEEASETVFVLRMAAHQVGEALKPEDKRAKGLQKYYENIQSPSVRARFFAIYSEAYGLQNADAKASPLQAPSKPLASQEQEQEQEQELGTPQAASPSAPAAPTKTGTRLPEDWTLPEPWRQWATETRPDLDAETVADSFRDFWVAKPGKDGRKADWLATWRNWVRNQKTASAFAQRSMSSAFAGAI